MLSFLHAALRGAADHSFSRNYSTFKIEGQRDSVKEKEQEKEQEKEEEKEDCMRFELNS
jgi:hypothetical protein